MILDGLRGPSATGWSSQHVFGTFGHSKTPKTPPLRIGLPGRLNLSWPRRSIPPHIIPPYRPPGPTIKQLPKYLLFLSNEIDDSESTPKPWNKTTFGLRGPSTSLRGFLLICFGTFGHSSKSKSNHSKLLDLVGKTLVGPVCVVCPIWCTHIAHTD